MYDLGIFSTFQRHGFTLLKPPSTIHPFLGSLLGPGYPPITSVEGCSLLTHWATKLDCPPGSALGFPHGTGWWRTGLTLHSDDQTLQPSVSNPESCALFLYLRSVPHTLDRKLLCTNHVPDFKNCNLKQGDLGKNPV